MKLFDAHCHLPAVAKAMLDTPDDGIDSLTERAAKASVAGMAICGTSPDDWVHCIDARKIPLSVEHRPVIYPLIGIHPWFVGGRDGSPSRPGDAGRPAVGPNLESLPFASLSSFGNTKSTFGIPQVQTLKKMLRDFPMLGIGETGLDFRDQFTNRAEQEASLAAHLDLANKFNRPVAVHCVHAWGRLLEMLREHPAPKILLHAYSGSAELIPELIGLNCWFSFGEAVMNPKAKRARAAVAAVPADRLLIETDAAGEPEKLVRVARAVAELRGVPVAQIADLTFENAQMLFSSLVAE